MSKFLSQSSIHLARTMMLEEIEKSLNHIKYEKINPDLIKRVIIEENCLSKSTGNNRISTCNKLISHYILNEEIDFFRYFLYFWRKNENTRNILAFLFSYSRDFILHEIMPYVLDQDLGVEFPFEKLDDTLQEKFGQKYSDSTIRSLGQNLRATLTLSGHLQGRVKKIRSKPLVDSNSVAYALFLGYSEGIRGELLFYSEYMKSIECSIDRGINLAFDASQRGYLDMKKVGNIIEIQFPKLNDSKG